MSVKISACMITRNEEDTIRLCLESIKDIVDEIVIVDNSTDKTAEICKEYTDKVIIHKFSGSMAEERNISLSEAKNEWCLIIDGDESISDAMKKYLTNFVPDEKYSGYAFARRNYYDKSCKRYTNRVYYPDYQTRLFKTECTFHRSTHELTKAVEGIVKYEPEEIYMNHFVPGRYSYKEFVDHWIPTSIKIQAKWDEERSKPMAYYILKLPFIFFYHFSIMYFIKGYILEGLIGLRIAIMMSMYFFMVNYYVIFDNYKIHE